MDVVLVVVHLRQTGQVEEDGLEAVGVEEELLGPHGAHRPAPVDLGVGPSWSVLGLSKLERSDNVDRVINCQWYFCCSCA